MFLVPWLDRSKVRSARFRPVYKWFFWILLLDCLLLGFVGGHPPSDHVFKDIEWLLFIDLGHIGTAWYFFHFLILLPLLGTVEKTKPLPTSITESVLDGDTSSSTITKSGGSM